MTFNKDYEDAMLALAQPLWVYEDSSEVYNEYDLDVFEWEHGCSKVAIILDDCVLKTAFSGYVIEKFDEDEGVYEDPKFVNYKDDPCLAEYKIYQEAVKEGLEYFFAEIKTTDCDGVFEQEKCEVTLLDFDYYDYEGEHNIKSLAISENSSIIKVCEDYELKLFGEATNYSLVSNFLIANYPLSELKRLQEFLKRYDINDLHSSNAGLFNGKIKIFDYSGYDSETYSRLIDKGLVNLKA